ncbi:hypothetical protein NP493_1290g01020 [Ridgeia piscesae]|uniref:Uncharacterized protein n=1 Tax=Ridgeia piscesae TaxID=27915 RepID=A0AAD9K948_RIDPI|nr:hypothetical protein NP493_1290g01020 [Ridgeia piscesae]
MYVGVRAPLGHNTMTHFCSNCHLTVFYSQFDVVYDNVHIRQSVYRDGDLSWSCLLQMATVGSHNLITCSNFKHDTTVIVLTVSVCLPESITTG